MSHRHLHVNVKVNLRGAIYPPTIPDVNVDDKHKQEGERIQNAHIRIAVTGNAATTKCMVDNVTHTPARKVLKLRRSPAPKFESAGPLGPNRLRDVPWLRVSANNSSKPGLVRCTGPCR